MFYDVRRNQSKLSSGSNQEPRNCHHAALICAFSNINCFSIAFIYIFVNHTIHILLAYGLGQQ